MAGRPVTGYTILPATVVGTAGLLLALITAARGWRHIGRWPVPGLGLSLPSVRWATLLSGVATAVIIATTTLNYTFAGISILLALLLMRGGVLIIAPFVDLTTRRRVSAFSWAAMALSLAAVGLALSSVGSYQMTLVAALNIAAYLGGYVVRLNVMSRLAKDVDPDVNRRYFFEETFVAAVALILIPSLVALVAPGTIAGELRTGFSGLFTSSLSGPALTDRAPLRRSFTSSGRGSTSIPGRTRSASRSIDALLCFRALRPRTSWRSSWAGDYPVYASWGASRSSAPRWSCSWSRPWASNERAGFRRSSVCFCSCARVTRAGRRWPRRFAIRRSRRDWGWIWKDSPTDRSWPSAPGSGLRPAGRSRSSPRWRCVDSASLRMPMPPRRSQPISPVAPR